MKKYLFYILILTTLAGVFGQPAFSATENTEYKLLAPIPCPTGSGESCVNNELKNFNAGSDAALGQYLNLIVRLVIGISAVLAVVMIVMGGIEYMGSELISSKEEGKSKIMNALFGLLIALGAYALLNTINPDLLNSDVKIEKAEVTVVVDDSVPQTAINGVYKNGLKQGEAWTGTSTGLPPNVGIRCSSGGTTVESCKCNTVGQRGCTSLVGLSMSKVLSTLAGCKCALTITGGSESWEHGGSSGSTSHGKNSGTVDLARSTQLDAWIMTGESNKTPQYGKRYGPNKEYYFEGNHWHVGA